MHKVREGLWMGSSTGKRQQHLEKAYIIWNTRLVCQVGEVSRAAPLDWPSRMLSLAGSEVGGPAGTGCDVSTRLYGEYLGTYSWPRARMSCSARL